MTQKQIQKQVIVAACGGLGNQMFQYAAGYALAKQHNAKLSLDLSAFHSPKKIPKNDDNSHSRPFGLNCFCANLPFQESDNLPLFQANRLWTRVIQKFLQGKANFIYRLDPVTRYVVENKGSNLVAFPQNDDWNNLYLKGYWQNERNFTNYESDIRQCFEFPKIRPAQINALKNKMTECGTNAISLHIRRGDYLLPKFSHVHLVDLTEYYAFQIDVFKTKNPNSQFFIFTDDPTWAKTQYTDNCYFIVEQSEADYWDMYLMSQCHHHIIANSSFSWWGAWLAGRNSGHKIAPKYWFNNAMTKSIKIIPDWWSIADV